MESAKSDGRMAFLGLNHGCIFLRLTFLRGYENLLDDFNEDEPKLPELIGMVEKFNAARVARLVELSPDVIGFPDDLGAQRGPLISPRHFREHLAPVYRRLTAPARERGILTHMHTDGDVTALLDDILAAGLDVVNPQDLVNGIDVLRKNLKGRAAIDLDIDRQDVTVRGSPQDIDDLIHEEVDKLGSPEGGLALRFGLYPETPLENVRAVMDAMEKYSTFYS